MLHEKTCNCISPLTPHIGFYSVCHAFLHTAMIQILQLDVTSFTLENHMQFKEIKKKKV
jgi:hypothetical protein